MSSIISYQNIIGNYNTTDGGNLEIDEEIDHHKAEILRRNADYEIRDVADLLGHKNIETTENYYISNTCGSGKKFKQCCGRNQ